ADDGQHLALAHVLDDLVGVAVGQQAGQAAVPRHAIAARVVDDDEVCPTGLGELRRDARARSRADDGAASFHFAVEAFQNLRPCVTHTCPTLAPGPPARALRQA